MRTLDPHELSLTSTAVLDALPVAAFTARPDGTISYLSRGWEQLTGNIAAQVVVHGYQEFVHPDDLPRVAAAWDSARAAGAPYRDELRVRYGDGSYRWMMSRAEPMLGTDGDILGWFGTVTNIDDLRTAEADTARGIAALAASAHQLEGRAHLVERLLDATDDCIKILDLDARLVSMSENGQKALAIMDFSSVAGADWLDFWSGDDRIAAAAAVDAARGGGRGRFTGLFAVEGREKWWDVSVTPILDADGRPEQLLAVSRDVTQALLAHRALARSEERYRILGNALPGVTWTATPDGLLDHISGSPSAARLPDTSRLGDAWLNTVHPDDREAVRERWHASLASGEPYDAQFRVRLADGTYRWQLVRGLPQHDSAGTIVRWVGVNVDIDAQRRADETREQFVRLVETSDDFVCIADANGKATYVNAAGRAMLEIAPEDTSVTPLVDYFAPEDRAFVETEILQALERDGRWRGEHRFRTVRTASRVPVWCNAFTLRDDAGRTTGMALVGRDLRERRRMEAGLRTLAETGAVMFRSLDYEQTLRNVAEAATRSFATYCIMDMVDADGRARCVAAVHSDPALSDVLKRAVRARAVRGKHPVARAIGEGAATLIRSVGPDWVRETEMHPDSEDDVRALSARSMLCLPIRRDSDGVVVGALTFVVDSRDERGGYTSDDLRFAQEVALRAGLAFDHARAYERESRIAATLQAASLPKTLPLIDDFTLSADYRPGNSEATIGGDWYDAFVLDDGRVGVTVGDILGKGLAAAVTMGKVRQAMRAVATLVPEPNAMLEVADHTVRAESADTYATAMAGIFDPATCTFTFASAGHPGPALRHPDGRIEEFASPGVLLGLRERGETRTVTFFLPAGSTLVLFTDGLVEATRDIDEGRRRLHAAMTHVAVAEDENPAYALVERVLAGAPATDDIAVLVAQVGRQVRS